MAEEKRVNMMVEIGRTGLTRFGGQVEEEWYSKLKGANGRKIYRQMADNDSVIGSFLYAIKMLCRQVIWRVEPAGDKKEDEENAKFVEECMNDMSMSWFDVITEVLSMLIYGWSAHELVYKKRNGREGNPTSKFEDGKIGWRKIPIRSQDSLYEWEFDDDGGIKAMCQQPPPDYIRRTIPIERLLLFRTESYKSSPEGRSILRNAYRPYYFKKNFEEIEGIGVERDLAGLPIALVPPELMDDDAPPKVKALYKRIQDLVQKVRRDELEGIVFPAAQMTVGDKVVNTGYELKLLSTGGRRQFDTTPVIQRYEKNIAMTVLADFLLIGHEAVGSFALSSSKTDMFALSLKALLDSICSVFNTYAIPRLFDLNGIKVEEGYPEIAYGDIETPDLAALGTFLGAMSGVGITLSDEETENYLREIASLPPKPEPTPEEKEIEELETKNKIEQLKNPQPPMVPGQEAKPGGKKAAEEDEEPADKKEKKPVSKLLDYDEQIDKLMDLIEKAVEASERELFD